MTQSEQLPPAFAPITLQRPACPRCKSSMMLVSIELERPGVDLHTFQCAVCNHVLTTLAACEDPMHSKVGRCLQGDLPPPK
jgi:transposase-like protein